MSDLRAISKCNCPGVRDVSSILNLFFVCVGNANNRQMSLDIIRLSLAIPKSAKVGHRCCVLPALKLESL